jgi:O-antigen/teichoic acid export membrane protein
VVYLAGGQATTTIAALIWLYFVPRAIGPAGMGEVAVATSVTALLGAVVTMGSDTLLVRDIARVHERAGSLVGSAAVVRLAWLVPVVALVALYTHVLHVGTEQAVLLWLATAGMMLASISAALQAAFTGLEQMQYVALASVLGGLLTRCAGIGLVLAGFGVIAMLASSLVISGVVLLMNAVWARRRFTPRWRPDRAEIRYVVSGSLTFWVGGLIFNVYLWIDTVILSAMAPVAVLGWYGVPIQIFSTALMVPVLIGTACFPRLSRRHGDGPDRLRSAARPALETILLLSLPLSAGLATVARPLVTDLYGPRFNGAIGVLVVLAITLVPTYFNTVAYVVLAASDRQSVWFRVVVTATVLNVLLNVVLIGWFQSHLHNGALGAAVSLLATEVYQSGWGLALLPWVVHAAFVRRLARALAATALMAVLVGLAGGLGLVAQIAVGLVASVALGLLLRIPSDGEMAQLRALGSRLRRSVRARRVRAPRDPGRADPLT